MALADVGLQAETEEDEEEDEDEDETRLLTAERGFMAGGGGGAVLP